MKLWHVAQWGNVKDGGNGPDTQCIIVAPTLAQAIDLAEQHFATCYQPYKDGKADVAYQLGDDGRPDGDGSPDLVISKWVQHAMNLRHYPAFYRHPETNEWLDQKTMYGEDA